MDAWLSVISWIAAIAIGLPIITIALECLIGLLPIPAPDASPPLASRRIAVLVPAHDEAAGLAATLAGIKAQLMAHDRLLVVADNCTDDTAQIARAAGAEVMERHDPAHRGKGYALSAGIHFLEASPPAVVVIIDADCSLHPGAIDHLVQQVYLTERPAQGIYLMHPATPADPMARISAFAFLVKNEARPRGLARLGQPVMLTGTGMAFPWRLIAQANLAGSELVEDLTLSLDLIRTGQGALLCPAARLYSDLPASRNSAAIQRIRWEHGYLAVLLRHTPKLVRLGFRTRQPAALLAAADLGVPPLSLLISIAVLVIGGTGVIGLLTADWQPAVAAGSATASLLPVLALVRARYAADLVGLRDILAIPRYLLWKAPIYLRFLVRRETRWIRTPRARNDVR